MVALPLKIFLSGLFLLVLYQLLAHWYDSSVDPANVTEETIQHMVDLEIEWSAATRMTTDLKMIGALVPTGAYQRRHLSKGLLQKLESLEIDFFKLKDFIDSVGNLNASTLSRHPQSSNLVRQLRSFRSKLSGPLESLTEEYTSLTGNYFSKNDEFCSWEKSELIRRGTESFLLQKLNYQPKAEIAISNLIKLQEEMREVHEEIKDKKRTPPDTATQVKHINKVEATIEGLVSDLDQQIKDLDLGGGLGTVRTQALYKSNNADLMGYFIATAEAVRCYQKLLEQYFRRKPSKGHRYKQSATAKRSRPIKKSQSSGVRSVESQKSGASSVQHLSSSSSKDTVALGIHNLPELPSDTLSSDQSNVDELFSDTLHLGKPSLDMLRTDSQSMEGPLSDSTSSDFDNSEDITSDSLASERVNSEELPSDTLHFDTQPLRAFDYEQVWSEAIPIYDDVARETRTDL